MPGKLFWNAEGALIANSLSKVEGRNVPENDHIDFLMQMFECVERKLSGKLTQNQPFPVVMKNCFFRLRLYERRIHYTLLSNTIIFSPFLKLKEIPNDIAIMKRFLNLHQNMKCRFALMKFKCYSALGKVLYLKKIIFQTNWFLLSHDLVISTCVMYEIRSLKK